MPSRNPGGQDGRQMRLDRSIRQAGSTHFTCTRVIRELSRDKWAVTSTPRSIRILGYRFISAKATSACAVRKAIKLNASRARAQPTFISNLRPTNIFASLRNETCWRHIRRPMSRLSARGRVECPLVISLRLTVARAKQDDDGEKAIPP